MKNMAGILKKIILLTAGPALLLFFAGCGIAEETLDQTIEKIPFFSGQSTGDGADASGQEPVLGTITRITTVTGVEEKIVCEAGDEVTLHAAIDPANGAREVQLQLFDREANDYRTILTETTADADTAEVTFTLPRENQTMAVTKWRIFVPKQEDTDAGVQDVTVITRNIASPPMISPIYSIYSMDEGEIIFGKDYDTETPMASTTKIMTSILAMEGGILDRESVLSEAAIAVDRQNLPCSAGESYRNADLFHALLICSSNTSAVALAESMDGSEQAFAERMNERARKMGLEHTHFVNAHGLDAEGHYTTARELSEMTAEAWQHDLFREVIKEQEYTFTSTNSDTAVTVETTDTMLKDGDPNFHGGKTGTTAKAGYVFSGVYEYNGKFYVTVNIGAGSDYYRWVDQKQLIEYIKKYGG